MTKKLTIYKNKKIYNNLFKIFLILINNIMEGERKNITTKEKPKIWVVQKAVWNTKSIVDLLVWPINDLKKKIKIKLENVKISDEKINSAIDSAIKIIADNPDIDIKLWLNIFTWLIWTEIKPWDNSHKEQIKDAKKMLEDFLKVLKSQLIKP